MRRYARPLLCYGHKIVSGSALIEDSIQEVFIQVWTYRKTLREDVGEVKAYLFASLRRRLIQERRHPAFASEHFDDIPTNFPRETSFTVEESLIETEREARQVALLAQWISALPKRQREALHLKYYANLTNQQIAEVMGVRYQTATNLIHEALVKLRQEAPRQALISWGLLATAHGLL